MLILASSSPRRRQLLTALGLDFTIEAADIDESALPSEAPEPHARRLAETKAQVVAARRPEDIVLAADTIVVQHDRIMGKPADPSDARRMLQDLRAAPHLVITAVAVAHPGGLISASHTSQVVMRDYTDADIDAYITSGDPLDKAGAYAIQHDAFRPVAAFDGCFASIMGLPLAIVVDLLHTADLEVQPEWPAACQSFTSSCCHFSAHARHRPTRLL